MGSKTEYSANEWGEVIAGPYFASMYIVVSDLNVAYFKEIAAMAKAVMETASATTNDLIRAVAVDTTAKDSQEEIRQRLEELKGQKDPEGMKKVIVQKVTSAADLVATKSAEDGEEYRRWLMHLAEVTADASKEGGFLGIGAVRVSDQEKRGLDELANVLGVSTTS